MKYNFKKLSEDFTKYKTVSKNHKLKFIKLIIIYLLLLGVIANFLAFVVDYTNIMQQKETEAIKKHNESYFLLTKSFLINDIHYSLLYWCHWQGIYIAVTSVFLILIETNIYIYNSKINEKTRNKYLYLKISSFAYTAFTGVLFNSTLFIYAITNHRVKLFTGDPTTISSICEHSVMPILFTLYFLISYKKSFVQNRYNVKTYFKFINKLSIIPYLYVAYLGVNIAFIAPGYYPYPQLDARTHNTNASHHAFEHLIEIFIFTYLLGIFFTSDIIFLNIQYKKIWMKIKSIIKTKKIDNLDKKTNLD